MAFVFLLSIKPHKPKSNDRFTSNFDWGTQQKHGNVLGLVLKFSGCEGRHFCRKKKLSFQAKLGSHPSQMSDILNGTLE